MKHMLQKNHKNLTWLMLLYQLPTQPSTQRVYVWRRLKSLGALYLQNSVCLLPDIDDHAVQLEKLMAEIMVRKGEARLLRLKMSEADESARMIAEFQQQADEEYEEFLGQCSNYHEELRHERQDGHFTFAELDENAQELEKIRTWLPKIAKRDFFGGSMATEAAGKLAECEQDFEVFTQEVGAMQGQAPARKKSTRKPVS